MTAVSRYVLHTFRFESGERWPCLVYRESWVPVTPAMLWVIQEKRNRRPATIENGLRGVKYLYDWCDARGVDLSALIKSGRTLSRHDVAGYARWLLNGRPSIEVAGRIGTLPTLPGTFNQYLRSGHEFLRWALEYYTYDRLEPDQRQHIGKLLDDLDRAFAVEMLPGFGTELIGLSADERESLEHAVSPDLATNPANPFRGSHLRYRNWLIVETFLWTGLRRGELLKLKTSDLPAGSRPRLHVRFSFNDPHDPRKREPRQKTRERPVPVPSWLSKAFHEYVSKHRGDVRGGTKPKSPRHPYLFTARDGSPMTSNAINAIFNCLAAASGVERLHPHLLRHTYASWLEPRLRAYCGETSSKRLLEILMGWSPGSEMTERYTRGAAREEAWVILDALFSSADQKSAVAGRAQ